MRVRKSQGWEEKAHQILDQFERGTRRIKLTRSGLAELAGVSRQTLWRNPGLRARVNQLTGSRSAEGGESTTRPTLAMQVRELKKQVDELEQTNATLVQNFLVICRALDERGIDPVELMGLSAPDLTGARRAAAWR
jgi:hypothetical protein